MKHTKKEFKQILLFTSIFILIIFAIGIPTYNIMNENNNNYSNNYKDIKQFSSDDEINQFLELNSQSYSSYYGSSLLKSTRTSMAEVSFATDSAVPMAESVSGAAKGNSDNSESNSQNSNYATDHSNTNNQVETVDESDIIKNDGKYIYYITNNRLYIVDAFPADNSKVLSEIKFDESSYPNQIFINDDKLVVIGYETKNHNSKDNLENAEPTKNIATTTTSNTGDDVAVSSKMMAPSIMPCYGCYGISYTFIKTYNISDKSSPEEINSISIEGNYFNSRMIGSQVYVISNKYTYNRFEPPMLYHKIDGVMKEEKISASDISYFDMPDYSYELTTILSLDLDTNDFSDKTILKGSSQNIYVSDKNIYLTSQKYVPYYYEQKRIFEEVVKEYLPNDVKVKIERIMNNEDIRESTKINEMEFIVSEYMNSLSYEEQQELTEEMANDVEKIQTELNNERQKTIIQRISIENGEIEYEANGEVKGTLLNQFSMDENGDYFRVATTTGYSWDEKNPSKNNVYVLDMDLDIVGKLEDLAQKEQIYSVRFIGDRVYMVTYRTIDPLFVIGLEDPTNPEVLGQLKIPGYSTYLHPYDENHIIGIGKETEEFKSENNEETIARVNGLKIALFDVTEVSSPKMISKVELGDRGTDSDALYDHKAFLFSPEKNLLVIPVRLAEIDENKYEGKDNEDWRMWAYGDYTFQGAYVYKLTVEDGFDLMGRITHIKDDSLEKAGYYYYSEDSIRRILYMDDVLYTVSTRIIKANDLSNELDEITTLELYDKPEEIVYDYPLYR